MRLPINMLGLGSNSSPNPSPWASPNPSPTHTPSQPTYSQALHLYAWAGLLNSSPNLCHGQTQNKHPPNNIGLGLKPPPMGKPKTHSSSQLGLGDGHVGYNGYGEHEDEGGMSYGRGEHEDEGGMASQAWSDPSWGLRHDENGTLMEGLEEGSG